MQDYNIYDRYRCGSAFITKNEFIDKIFACLKDFPYSGYDFISIKLKAKRLDVEKILQDEVVKYIKENPDMSFKDVCNNLKIHSTVIDTLINNGRIEKKETQEDLTDEEINSLTNINLSKEDRRKRVIEELASLYQTSENKLSNQAREKKTGFHSSIRR